MVTVCVTLYKIEQLLKHTGASTEYVPASVAGPVYATMFLFMFIHTLIKSANNASAAFLISTLCEAAAQ